LRSFSSVGTRSEELKCRVLRDQFYRSSKALRQRGADAEARFDDLAIDEFHFVRSRPLSGSTGASETTVVASVPSYQIPTVLSVA